jgi:hypothetical protein
MEQFINGKNYSIKRFRWDKDLYKQKKSPWKDVGFAAHGANGFEMEKRPLGEGAGESLFSCCTNLMIGKSTSIDILGLTLTLISLDRTTSLPLQRTQIQQRKQDLQKGW